MADDDVFASLAEWAEKTERKVHRRRVLRRLPAFLAVAALLGLLAFATPPLWRALTAAGTQPYSATTLPAVAPVDPFAGTPAAGYSRGTAGITLPAATAVPGFTGAQVEDALQHVRRALVAARLDRRMLTDHDPAGLVAMFAVNQRDRVRKHFRDRTHLSFATWIDPAVGLDPIEQPRVSGRISYAGVTVDGLRTLRVTTNFVWVYAFQRGDRPIAAAHEEVHWEFPATANLRAGDHGMWLGDVRGYTAWVDCAAAGRGLLAPTPPGAGPGASDDQDDLLRADHTIDIDGNCP